MAGTSRFLILGIVTILLAWPFTEGLQAESVPVGVNRPPGRVLFQPRFYPFTIDPKTPMRDLMPMPPQCPDLVLPMFDNDLAKVPEVMLQDPSAIKIKVEKEKSDKSKGEKNPLEFVEEQIAHQIAKINHLNKEKTDRFVELLLAQRPDLAGLPFKMGDDGRLDMDRSKSFFGAVNRVQSSVHSLTSERTDEMPRKERVRNLWFDFELVERNDYKSATVESVAALMQILGAATKDMQVGLANHLGGLSAEESIYALARLAIFSSENEVRQEALKHLRQRPSREIDNILLAGLRYPWPAIAKNAAQTIVNLERGDLVPHLVDLLEEADPRSPYHKQIDKKKVTMVRELVKINHHRNCLLCHAPGNTEDVIDKKKRPFGSGDVVLAPIPLPGQPFPSRFGYDRFGSPDILVRVDVTYLRQDFSMLLPVKDAKPWPDQQRFDFLVRTRVVNDKEAKQYRDALAKAGPSPYHAAAHNALKNLTGGDAEPTAAAWRQALKE